MDRRQTKSKISPLDGDTSNLPCENIENILSRLPVKSLMRFNSVSKPWYSLISDSKFARLHFQESKKKSSESGTLFVSRLPNFSFIKFTNNSFELEQFEFPLEEYREAEVLCACDGIIILKNKSPTDQMYVLWNPSIRTYTMFSCPYQIKYLSDPQEIPMNELKPIYGLCYDASNDDYKFVLTLSDSYYAVYSCKNNSWVEKQEDGIMLDWDKVYTRKGLFVNGALHWVTARCVSRVNEGINIEEFYEQSEICCFDPKDDKFKKLSQPSCFDISSDTQLANLGYDINTHFMLTNLGGQLSLYRNMSGGEVIEIWMMIEYGDFKSWIKLETMENDTSLCRDKFCSIVPLCLTNKSDIVLHIKGSGLVVYNPDSKKFSNVHIYAAGAGAADHTILKGKGIFCPELCWNESLLHIAQ